MHPFDEDDLLYHEESDFFDTKKDSRQARKFASKKDRSKYKKTDAGKRQKQIDQIAEKREENKDLKRGIVLNIRSQELEVDHDGKLYSCTLRGVLKKEKSKLKNLVIVGDFVLFEETGSDTGAIVRIEERKSVLSRKESLTQQKEHLIAANIDQVLITVSVVNPVLRPTIIDRYLIAASKGNLKPIIVCNKIDLLTDSSRDPQEIEKEKELLDACKKIYSSLGILFIETSVETGLGIQELQEAMKGHLSVFSGQSGAGKSSLINATTSHVLATSSVVKRTRKGSHTTSFAQLLPLREGGFCIDTPGIKSFGVWALTSQEVREAFAEILDASTSCKFPDCLHRGETGCAILQAVEEGKVSPQRYESYLTLLASIEKEHRRR